MCGRDWIAWNVGIGTLRSSEGEEDLQEDQEEKVGRETH